MRSSEPSPIETLHAGGAAELVQLDPDHPGFHDPIYRRRRDAIARLALEYRAGDPVPEAEYTEAEHRVWRTVWHELAPLHDRYACAAYRGLVDRIGLDRTRIPQLAEVNRALMPIHGFSMLPVAGLVSARTFLSYLADRVFLSTQYIRHHSVPLYTPEPDVVHELVGHAATFADEDFCALNLAFGRAASRAADPVTMERIGRLYWYTLEFGAVDEGGALKVYGAGLLSSFGELSRFETEARLRPFDIEAVCATPYDPTCYQASIFVAPSFRSMRDDLLAWLERA